MTEYHDIPRAEVIAQAEELARQGWFVYFKFTCGECGERCILQERNTLYERGECCRCGHETELSRVGFMLVGASSDQ